MERHLHHTTTILAEWILSGVPGQLVHQHRLQTGQQQQRQQQVDSDLLADGLYRLFSHECMVMFTGTLGEASVGTRRKERLQSASEGGR